MFTRNEEYTLRIDRSSLAADDAARKKRLEIAERLRQGKTVQVDGLTGEMKTAEDAALSEGPKYTVDRDKLAARGGFYWYEKKPELFSAEKLAMKKFPRFTLGKLDDDRLYWLGQLNPNGNTGGVWTVMAVYDHNHPHNNSYGGSVKVYSVKPDLNELYDQVGTLPHVLRDTEGTIYMCTGRPQDILVGGENTSAATHIVHATKWIKLVEDWLVGIIGDEIFRENFY